MQAFSNQVNNMTCFVVLSLFSQLSLCLSNGPMNEVAIVARMEDMHRLNNMNFPLSRAALDTTIAGCSVFQEKRST